MPFRLSRCSSLLREIVRQESISTIYINSLVLFPIARAITALKADRSVRVIWQIRELLNPRLSSRVFDMVRKSVAAASDMIVAISTNEGDPFESLATVEVIHNTVTAEFLRFEGLPHSSQGEPRVTMSCDFYAGKGIPDFLLMAELVHRQFPEAHFHLYTNHPRLHTGVTHRIIRGLGLWNERIPLVVEILGRTRECQWDGHTKLIFDHATTFETYRQTTVYVRADRAGCPWGRDIIEAMWAGLPIVATGSSEEFIIEGETGFLVPPERPDLLADRVCRLLSNETLRTSMGTAARSRALKMFSPDLFRSKLHSVFLLPQLQSS